MSVWLCAATAARPTARPLRCVVLMPLTIASNFDITRLEHTVKMKNTAGAGNIGHFESEVQMAEDDGAPRPRGREHRTAGESLCFRAQSSNRRRRQRMHRLPRRRWHIRRDLRRGLRPCRLSANAGTELHADLNADVVASAGAEFNLTTAPAQAPTSTPTATQTQAPTLTPTSLPTRFDVRILVE